MSTKLLAAGLTALLIAASSVTAGCTSAADEPLFGPDSSPLERSLADGRAFSLTPRSDAGSLVAKGVFTMEYDTYPMDLDGGSLEVELVDGALVLQEMTLRITGIDYVVPSTGARLDSMVLTLPKPTTLAATWSDVKVSSSAPLTLHLEWSIDAASGPIALAPQTVEVPLELSITETEGGLVLDAHIEDEGKILEVEQVLEVSEIDLAIAGSG